MLPRALKCFILHFVSLENLIGDNKVLNVLVDQVGILQC